MTSPIDIEALKARIKDAREHSEGLHQVAWSRLDGGSELTRSAMVLDDICDLADDLIAAAEVRPCTCHPSEAPVPCERLYALTECCDAKAERLSLIARTEAAEAVAKGVRNNIPMDYLERHPGDLVASVRDFAKDRWTLIDRITAANSRTNELVAQRDGLVEENETLRSSEAWAIGLLNAAEDTLRLISAQAVCVGMDGPEGDTRMLKNVHDLAEAHLSLDRTALSTIKAGGGADV